MCNIKEKKILVIGAGRGNLGLVKTAKKNGVKTIITGYRGDYPCTPLADKNIDVDIFDTNAILNVAKEEKVDGAISCCSDMGLKAIGKCNDILNMTGISENTAVLCSNKFLMKERLVSNGVRTATFMRISSIEELHQAYNCIGFPLIIKAVDLQGSKGVYIVKEESMLEKAFCDVMEQTKQDFCIIEEYLIGKEFGAQAFVYNEEVLFVLPHGDETRYCKTAIPIGHYMPYEMDDYQNKDVREQATKAIKALKLNNCAVNIDFIERNGLSYIIELTGRVGANSLPELTSNYYGINYYNMILSTALGISPLPFFAKRKAPCATMSRMIFSDKTGVVSEINIPTFTDAEIHMFIKKGDKVRSFTSCNDALGEVIVKAKNLTECQKIIDKVISKISIKYE